jgi:glycosyltransferase involved in cell wall biosynthesis
MDWRNTRTSMYLYAGFVDDIEAYFTAADLFLNPVQSGGGIKTKMVEAIAYGATVIATETGATGINREVCGQKLITVPDNDWTGFAKAVIAQRDQQAVTPAGYYDYYYWKNLARRIAAIL